MVDSEKKKPIPAKSQRSFGQRSSRALWLGPLVMLGAFLLVFGMIVWLNHESTRRARLAELTARADSLGEALRQRLRGDTDYLLMLAHEQSSGRLGPEAFQQRAGRYVRLHPEMTNITWVDADFFIRDVAPLAGNSQILGLHLDLPEPDRASHLAKATRAPAFTRPFEAIQGKSSFEVWVPVYRGETFLGLLAGVYSTDRLLKLLDTQSLRPRYHLSLVNASGALLSESPWAGSPDSLAHADLVTSRDSGVYLRVQGYRQAGQDWRLTVLELLCLPLVFATALAFFKLKRENEERRRVEASLKEKSEQLEREIAERRAVQEALQQQTVVLEEEMTERLEAAEELLRKKAELQSILDSTPALIYLKGRDGRYLFVNRPWCEMVGAKNAEVVGRTDQDIFPEPIAEQLIANDHKALERGEAVELEEEFMVAGARRTFHSIKVALTGNDGSSYALCGISTDVTQQRKTEEMLHQSQKLESIGRLAGGVAHDFNNMLSVIAGCAELALLKVGKDDPVWPFLQQILRAAERSGEMTRQLLAFSRKGGVPAKRVDLNKLILQSERSLGRLIGEDIDKALELVPDLWPILIAPSQVDQVLMNLSINSRDAMPAGGVLKIETANVRIGEDAGAFAPNASPGEYVRLTVSDTGTGMDRETVEHIFEPFFTTKEVGKGTGLGLATVYGIIRQNNGFIQVDSEPGRGTVVRLFFPRCEREEEEPEPAPASPAVHGSGTVLFVEDDPLVRQMILQMLHQIGYTVVQAETPQQAIEICRQHRIPIDLILTDVVMPGMNGREMAEAIVAFRTDVKVLFMSGYTSDLLALRGVAEEGRAFIQKPFDLKTLNERIVQVLAES